MRSFTRTLLITALVLLGMLLGSDAVVAFEPHDDLAASHHSVVVQECGPDYQPTAQAPLLPSLAEPPTLPTQVRIDRVARAAGTDQILTLADAASLRAMLQVYRI